MESCVERVCRNMVHQSFEGGQMSYLRKHGFRQEGKLELLLSHLNPLGNNKSNVVVCGGGLGEGGQGRFNLVADARGRGSEV